MDTMFVAIEMVLIFILGLLLGFLYGLCRHAKIYEWFSARFFCSMRDAMRSCGWSQKDIDAVLDKMGKQLPPCSSNEMQQENNSF